VIKKETLEKTKEKKMKTLYNKLNESPLAYYYLFSINDENEIHAKHKQTNQLALKIRERKERDQIKIEINPLIYMKNNVKMPLILDETPLKELIAKWLFTESIHRIRLMNGTLSSLVYIRPENMYEDKLLDASIKELNLTIRAFNCLWRDGYDKVGDVTLLSKKQLREIPQMGNYSIESVIEEMKNIGYPVKEL